MRFSEFTGKIIEQHSVFKPEFTDYELACMEGGQELPAKLQPTYESALRQIVKPVGPSANLGSTSQQPKKQQQDKKPSPAAVIDIKKQKKDLGSMQ